ncbi:MAG: hypothetical protein ABIB11_02680 [Candidatus Omnitrophota bacterium]
MNKKQQFLIAARSSRNRNDGIANRAKEFRLPSGRKQLRLKKRNFDMSFRCKKGGVLAVVIIFTFILSTLTVLLFRMLWSRAPLYSTRLKRTHAIKYAEPALFETMARFRSNTSPYDEWDASQWALWVKTSGALGFVPTDPDDDDGDVLLDTGDRSVYPAGQPIVRFTTPTGEDLDVAIDVEEVTVGTATRNKIKATVRQNGIKLRDFIQ